MPSSWIVARPTKPDGRNKGRPRYRVVYPLAGSGSPHHYGGSFATKAEALERKKWVDGELAGLRGEEIAARLKERSEPVRPVPLRETGKAATLARKPDPHPGTLLCVRYEQPRKIRVAPSRQGARGVKNFAEG